MKKIVHFLILLLLLALAISGAEETKKVAKVTLPMEIYRAYAEGKFAQVLDMTDKAMAKQGQTMELIHMKYEALVRLNRLDDALKLIDGAIKQKGELDVLLSARFNVLFMQDKLPEALKTALKKDKIAKTKSPWDCMNLMHVFLKMNSKDEAMDWLQEAVNRGFISYRILMDKKYELLKNETRFYEIIETIKASIGLGDKAKLFDTVLLSGETFNLAQQRGKVVLVTFWATWCDACQNDFLELKNIHESYRDKGLEIISISLDSSLPRLKLVLEKEKLNWKHACSTLAWTDPVVTRYGVNSLPAYWLIDKKGVLRSFDLKGMDLSLAIKELLGER